MHLGSRNGPWRLLASAALALVGLVAVPGCSSCDGAQITLTPITRADLAGPITLEARMISRDKPVVHAPLTFYLLSEGSDSRWKGQPIGSAETDANGVASLTFGGPLSSLELVGYEIRGYGADFQTPRDGPLDQRVICAQQGRYDLP